MKWVYLLITIITSACIVGCATPEIKEEHEFSEVCQKLMEYIAEANATATTLPNFRWPVEMESLGFYKDSSNTDLITLKEILHEELLPGASLVLEKCQECSNCATKTLSSDPYDKPRTVAGEMEMITIEQWRNMCIVLQNDLKDAVVSAQECESRVDKLFEEIVTSRNRKVWAANNFWSKFINGRDRYKQTYRHIIIYLQKALTVAEQLETWEFKSLTTSEQKETTK